MTQQRFALEWDRPSLPDASTHVSLFDGGKDPLHVVASGHGAGDANALRDLLTTLRERQESADVIASGSGADDVKRLREPVRAGAGCGRSGAGPH